MDALEKWMIILVHQPTKMKRNVLSKYFAKGLERHSSASPNQQRRPFPSLLSLSFFYAVTPPICKVTCQYLALYRMQSGPYLECVMSCAEKKGLCIGMRGITISLYNLFVNAQTRTIK